MTRPLRLDHAGAIWHVTSRGNERHEIFHDDEDRRRFLAILGRVVERFRWRVHAYVLMGNHYHLLIETPEPTLSRGMHHLNGIYTQGFNRRHARVGHLLQGRFKAILVEKEAHLLELARYVVLNPVRAGITTTAGQWKWSNYRATAGLGPASDWLEVEWTLEQFPPHREAQRRYRAFVAEGKGSDYAPWEELVSQIYLGGEGFRRRAREMVSVGTRSNQIPRLQRLPARPRLADIVAATSREFGVEESELRCRRHTPARLAVAYLARHEAALKLTEFAPALGVQDWAASHLATSAERLAQQARRFRQSLDRIQRSLAKLTDSQTRPRYDPGTDSQT
jgi:REP-associated tyrosine transposase